MLQNSKELRQTYIKLHLSIMLAGLTGIFGKLITLNEGLLVWYRLLFTSVLVFVFLLAIKKLPKVSFRDFRCISIIGGLLATHWIFFYGSIKASNVSIGVVCFSAIGFFTAIFEPLILRTRFSIKELLYSLITLVGVALIFSFDLRFRTGIIMGIISSALASLFTISTKKIGKDYPPRTILLYEMLGGFIVLSLILPFYLKAFPVQSILPDVHDFIYLLLFSVFCTILLQILQIQVLKKISAFTANLSYNLEPVYSIILAMLFLGEAKELNYAFYAGVSLIVLSVLLQMRSSIKENNAIGKLQV